MSALQVAVTGGSGFLGSSVVAALSAEGHRVTSLDVRPVADPPPGVSHRILDVTDAVLVDRTIGELAPDVVVHLAAIVTPGKAPDRAREHAVDVGGSENVVAACLRHGVRRLVVASSGAAYGYHRDAGAAHAPDIDGVPTGWLCEVDPLRGNPEFAYSHHKRLVEELLARTRSSHPELEQVILRIGTILGAGVDNQITALFERPRLLRIAGAPSPFVFVWDTDVAAAVVRAVTGPATGAFNVAGDGAVTITQIAAELNKPVLTVPAPVVREALRVARWLRLTPYGPEQVRFLQFRPVLWNRRLIEVLGHRPEKTSLEAFRAWARLRGLRGPGEPDEPDEPGERAG